MALYDIPIHTLQGDDTTLGDYAGKTLLLVNVASKCGLTPQYEGLERLQKTYGDKGFSVVGFPCNQFMGQEPGTAEEIEQFCSATYGVTFPLTEKIEVNGEDRHPIYAELTEKADAEGNGRRHHVELREVPRLAGRRDRGPLPAPGRARGPRRSSVTSRRSWPPLDPAGPPVAAGVPPRPSSTWTGCSSTPRSSGTRPRSRSWAGSACPSPSRAAARTKGMFVDEVTAHWYGLYPWTGPTPPRWPSRSSTG